MNPVRAFLISLWHRIFPPIETRVERMLASGNAELVQVRTQVHTRLDELDGRLTRAMMRK